MINILQGSAVTHSMLGGQTIYPLVANFLWCITAYMAKIMKIGWA